MAYVAKKKIKGRTYYYAVKGQRQGSKVKQIILQYLGSVENIIEKYEFWEQKHR